MDSQSVMKNKWKLQDKKRPIRVKVNYYAYALCFPLFSESYRWTPYALSACMRCRRN